ncbi:hypothetical protein M3484_02225 [Pseudomonas sp. GX19020]|uniref:hypothetical protein n=1 Tax=Pseudomonas sp. GX19020 TaxID=2942277 RepID=UPI0020189984|nr:hypothetical protein [Pseudomonas sp. GX19020]MCL4065391.1 hypothetical protein [Pseudomonas sp. GX19020]
MVAKTPKVASFWLPFKFEGFQNALIPFVGTLIILRLSLKIPSQPIGSKHTKQLPWKQFSSFSGTYRELLYTKKLGRASHYSRKEDLSPPGSPAASGSFEHEHGRQHIRRYCRPAEVPGSALCYAPEKRLQNLSGRRKLKCFHEYVRLL